MQHLGLVHFAPQTLINYKADLQIRGNEKGTDVNKYHKAWYSLQQLFSYEYKQTKKGKGS